MTSAPSAPGDLPRVFGRYALFDRIGKGGMAEIFLARARTELGGARLVVVKQILPELAEQDAFAELLIREAKLAARLTHANVVQVTDLGRHEGRLFIAMEYVEGFDLNDLLRRCSRMRVPLPVEFGLLVISETLRGLDYAHRRVDDDGKPLGLVHRDVSPSNVLVSFEGEVKLCDFGIAHANDARAASPESIQGKAGYMAPEHARGEHIDHRADLFAAGVLLWEVLAGRRYYRASEGQSLVSLAREAAFQPPPARGLPFEEELHAVVRRALEADREARYPSAQAMLRDLDAYVAHAGLLASPLRFGAWLREHLADETSSLRRARERAMRALELGPPVVISPIVDRPQPPLPATHAQQEAPAEKALADRAPNPPASDPANPTTGAPRAQANPSAHDGGEGRGEGLPLVAPQAGRGARGEARWLVLVLLLVVGLLIAYRSFS